MRPLPRDHADRPAASLRQRSDDRADRRASLDAAHRPKRKCRCGGRSHVEPAPSSALRRGTARRARYLAVAGGFDATRVLGSLATDVNARLGDVRRSPAARARSALINDLGADDTMRVHEKSRASSQARSRRGRSIRVRGCDTMARAAGPACCAAPISAHSMPHSRGRCSTANFASRRESNRVGLRLEADRRCGCQLHSNSSANRVATGTVQLPPGGQPIVLMVEHPTTGGYPRIGQIAAVDLPTPGASAGRAMHCVSREIDLDEAQTRYLERERELALLIETICRTPRPHEARRSISIATWANPSARGAMGQDAEVMPWITSANIACGFHAGDPDDDAAHRGACADAPASRSARTYRCPILPVSAGARCASLRSRSMRFDAVPDRRARRRSRAPRARDSRPRQTSWRALQHGGARCRARRRDCMRRARFRCAPDPVGLAGSELPRAGEARRPAVAHEAFADRRYEAMAAS